MKKGLVLSDLHLGQFAARGGEALGRIRAPIARGDVSLIVLNGDIIEGVEITGSNAQLDARFDAACSKLRDMIRFAVDKNPECRIIYVIGNHDTSIQIRDRLHGLKAEFPNHFEIEETAFKYKDTLFTHGDLALNLPDSELIKARLSGRLRQHVGITDTRPGEGFSGWKTTPERTGPKAWKTHAKAIISAADEVITALVVPVEIASHVQLNTLREHDAQHPQAPYLKGTKRILMGHVHPQYGTRCAADGIEFLFTGSSTAFSRNAVYQFDIGEHALENFNLVEPQRTQVKR